MFKKLLLLVFPLGLSAVNLNSIEVTSTQSLEEEASNQSHSINLIDEKKVQTHQIDTLSEVSNLVPNLNISGIWSRSNKTFTLRGISNYVAYQSSVAMIVDDVPIPFSYANGLLDMNNIASIAFIKGAGGAIFGKGAQSGVMKIYTKAPSKENSAKVSFELGSFNHKAMSASLSGATEYKYLNYALSFTKETSDGYVKNTLTGNHFDSQEMYAIGTKLEYKPSNDFDITLNYAKLKSDDGGSPFSINSTKRIKNIDDEPIDEFSKLESDRLGLVMHYKWGAYSLRSSTSYVKQSMNKRDYTSILKGLSLLTDTMIEEFIQDLQLKRSFEHSDLKLGLFYSKKLSFNFSEEQILWNLYPMVLRSKNKIEDPDDVLAVSAEYNYYIDDKFILTAGVRYEESKRDFDRNLNKFGENTTHANASNTWKKFLPSLSMSYFIDETSLLYLSYAKGFRIGGYNYRSPDTLTPYKEEISSSYELGYKSNFKHGLTLNSTIFYNSIKDMRVVSFNDTLGSTLYNASKAYSYGLEFDMKYQKENFLLYASLGLNRAKYEHLEIDAKDYSGNNIIEAPNLTASLGMRYDFYKNLYMSSSLSYMGERYYNAQNTAKAKAYTTTNLSLGYKNRGWEVELYAKNIFDKAYIDFMISTPSNNYNHFGLPRTLGVKLSKNF